MTDIPRTSTRSYTNDIDDFIGQRFESCWKFVQAFYLHANGTLIDELAHTNRDIFAEVKTPLPGDLVLIKTGGTVSHAGIYWGRGVLHCTPDKGVVYQGLRNVDSIFYRLCVARPVIFHAE